MFDSPNGIAIDVNGDIIVSDFGGSFNVPEPGSIIKVDPITGAQTIISSGGLLIDPAGIFIVPQSTPTEDDDKITICHKPGTPAEKTLQVPESAVPGHLKHGDTLGECVAP